MAGPHVNYLLTLGLIIVAPSTYIDDRSRLISCAKGLARRRWDGFASAGSGADQRSFRMGQRAQECERLGDRLPRPLDGLVNTGPIAPGRVKAALHCDDRLSPRTSVTKF